MFGWTMTTLYNLRILGKLELTGVTLRKGGDKVVDGVIGANVGGVTMLQLLRERFDFLGNEQLGKEES